jgi:hypothetical protein
MLLSILAHNPEPGDPVLLEWIMHQLESIFGLSPGVAVLALGLAIVAIPMGIIAAYMWQRTRQKRR